MNSGNPNADAQGNHSQAWHTNATPDWQPHATPHALPQAHYVPTHNGSSHQGGFVPPPCGLQMLPELEMSNKEMIRAGRGLSSASYVPPQPSNSFQAPRPSPNVLQTPHQSFHGFQPSPQTPNSFQQSFPHPGNFQPPRASPNSFQQPFPHPGNFQQHHASPNGFQQPFPHPGNHQPPRASPNGFQQPFLHPGNLQPHHASHNSFQQPPQSSSNSFQRPPQRPNSVQTTFPRPQNPQAAPPPHTRSTHVSTPPSPYTATEASRQAGLDIITTMTTLSALDQKRVRHLEGIIHKLRTRCSNYQTELQQEKAKAARHRQEHATCRDHVKQLPPTPKSTQDAIPQIANTSFEFSPEELLVIDSFDSQLDAIMREMSEESEWNSASILGPLASPVPAPVPGIASASPSVRACATASTSPTQNPHGKKRPHASPTEPLELDVRFPDGTAISIPNPTHPENEPAKKKSRKKKDKDTLDADMQEEEFKRDWEVYLKLNDEADALLEKFDEQLVIAQGLGN